MIKKYLILNLRFKKSLDLSFNMCFFPHKIYLLTVLGLIVASFSLVVASGSHSLGVYRPIVVASLAAEHGRSRVGRLQ